MTSTKDRLFELLPVVYRQRDHEEGYPLKALLQVISEQVDLVEQDIEQLYRNWFIETCQDWAVPYLGDLVGYRMVEAAGKLSAGTTAQGRELNRVLVPRREVANTARYRRRKGSLFLLELLARDVAAWPARAVEFYRLLGWTQALNHQRLVRGGFIDLRDGDALDDLGGPFDRAAHSGDVRRIDSERTQGRTNIPSVGVFLWRLGAYSVGWAPAYCAEAMGSHCFNFSVLGNDAPLFTRPEPEPAPEHIAGPLHVPAPITRRRLESNLDDYYGIDKSFAVWVDGWAGYTRDEPLPSEALLVADLSDWHYRPPAGRVAIDPVLGRLAFPPRQLPHHGVWVRYHYGFSADMGGGEYPRALSQPDGAVVYRVGASAPFQRISDALARFRHEQPAHAVLELCDGGVHVEQINIELLKDQSLQIRAADGTRPVLRMMDWQAARPDALWIRGQEGSRITLDGLLVTGRGVQVEGPVEEVCVRHCTLVPGWTLDSQCEPVHATEPSLQLVDTRAQVRIERSILGTIQVSQDEVGTDPIAIHVCDSIVDATSEQREALGAPTWPLAHAVLTIQRSTVIGQVEVHAIELAEDSIFMGEIHVARSQLGCMRFCYVTPCSRTPRRYRCQPDLALEAAAERIPQGVVDPQAWLEAEHRTERARVRPRFNSLRYGLPAYGQLATCVAPEIWRGASDEAEMGAFHDLYQPQRETSLRVRLDEFTPAGMVAGVVYAS